MSSKDKPVKAQSGNEPRPEYSAEVTRYDHRQGKLRRRNSVERAISRLVKGEVARG